ncbi:N-6 DNA methylase [Thalassoglobus sp. JC818]|uniref:Eco57I restriction-modification methylase domain-containing protein n=1 Tax=Thalassoglobus sp. JC818 TaxID=3232136 RepID=UPI003457871F
MPLDFSDCQFQGPALPDPFVKFELEKELKRNKLLRKTTGKEGKELKQFWDGYRRKLRSLAASGGALRVRNHVIEPLTELLGYSHVESAPDVKTREDREAGGVLLVSEDGESKLRLWVTSFNEDLFAPSKRGRAYRFSHLRIAQRVLLASGERFGLLTNGIQLMLLISDPARPDSTVTIPIDPGWKRSRDLPDSLLLLLALASPAGVKALPDLVDKARLQQARVTKELRVQARQAVERFIQEIIDHPSNREWFQSHEDKDQLAKDLWHEGLITVYRLLFILKLESSDNPAQSFTFASTSLWRNTFSPSIGLAGYAREVLEQGAETGSLLEQGLRNLFKMFDEGLECTELMVKPLGGALFGLNTTPHLAKLKWGERAVAHLLDRLLWTPLRRGADTRERVHYGPLDVEDLGRVYEALLELEPGISGEPMCRLRRSKLEVVVPLEQGEKYRPTDNEESSSSGTSVEWIERIEPGQFYLRVGLGRKASGSYYTPHSFVRFLVQETLGPQVEERSPQKDPNPLEILKLKVLDPAMGSGHFLVEACRYLGHHLYEACRLCDENAMAAERRAERGKKAEREAALEEAAKWRQRVIELPDPDDEMLKYLPSRSPEGEETGYSQQRAEALCRRLVSTHCLYGVDKNPLAVELAKLALWLESHAEGMPLTFLDHRLVLGDSLTGPFWNQLVYRPSKPDELIQGLFADGLNLRFQKGITEAIRYVRQLDASVGSTVSDLIEKANVKAELDDKLLPFRIVAAAWCGGVLLGPDECDDHAYSQLLSEIADTGQLPSRIESRQVLSMVCRGLGLTELPNDRASIAAAMKSTSVEPALPYDLAFPEVFFPTGVPFGRRGFNAILGNPPWDTVTIKRKEWFASFDFEELNASNKRERDEIEAKVLSVPENTVSFNEYVESFEQTKRVFDALYSYQKVQVEGDLAGRFLDLFRVFMERNAQLLDKSGMTGVVVPSAFHANEGATGVRQLYLNELKLGCCYSFENKRKLFEIHSSFKFAVVTAAKTGPTHEFPCRFYLHDDSWLFEGMTSEPPFTFSKEFVERTGGALLAFSEFSNPFDFEVCRTCLRRAQLLGENWDSEGQAFSTSEVNLTNHSDLLEPIDRFKKTGGWLTSKSHSELLSLEVLPLFEGKCFWHFDVHFAPAMQYVVPVSVLESRKRWFKTGTYYRSAYRKFASSTNERTMVWALLPPAVITSEGCPAEWSPWIRPNSNALARMAALNTFIADYLLRLRVAATVNMFLLRLVAIPKLDKLRALFLAHGALRHQSQDERYLPLWNEQLGENWRESCRDVFSWPALQSEDERWQIRTQMDAVVADAYGLTREQYEHVLSTFSHSSYPSAPELCLAAFDELKDIGLEAFTKKHDPYHDIPLNENLPEPVINLPIPGEEEDNGEFKLTGTPEKTAKK